MASDHALDISVSDSIARVTLNRPEKRNALNPQMMREMKSFLDSTKYDPAVKVVVIDAAGPHFSAGHDYMAHLELAGPRPWVEEQSRAYLDFIFDHWYWPLKDYPKPIISAVHGVAGGGGAELSLLTDITIASRDAVFDYSILRSTGVFMTQMLVFTAGFKAASELYLTGGWVYADEAYRLGMVNRVVSRENLANEAMRMATIVTRMPDEVVRLNKLATRHAFDLMGMREAWFYGKEADILVHLVGGDDVEAKVRYTEGIQAANKERRERFADLETPYS